MGVKFFIDAGLGPNVAQAMRLFGRDVEHVNEVFGEGTLDDVWLPYVGDNQIAVILKDKGVKTKPNERLLFRKHKVVAFYLRGSEKSGHDIAKQLVNAWEKMEQKAKKQFKKGTAGAFSVYARGTEIKQLW